MRRAYVFLYFYLFILHASTRGGGGEGTLVYSRTRGIFVGYKVCTEFRLRGNSPTVGAQSVARNVHPSMWRSRSIALNHGCASVLLNIPTLIYFIHFEEVLVHSLNRCAPDDGLYIHGVLGLNVSSINSGSAETNRLSNIDGLGCNISATSPLPPSSDVHVSDNG